MRHPKHQTRFPATALLDTYRIPSCPNLGTVLLPSPGLGQTPIPPFTGLESYRPIFVGRRSQRLKNRLY